MKKTSEILLNLIDLELKQYIGNKLVMIILLNSRLSVAIATGNFILNLSIQGIEKLCVNFLQGRSLLFAGEFEFRIDRVLELVDRHILGLQTKRSSLVLLESNCKTFQIGS